LLSRTSYLMIMRTNLGKLDILWMIIKTFGIVFSVLDFAFIQMLNPCVGLIWTLGASIENTSPLEILCKL